ncbi:fluoride efflux transporter CrcB [Undibacterium sp. RTI2.1]|uniref:fluoride efflux transporter CrcB n=1 Tax=unclassified Undibacterium TaxID=2630295 RepID=UPI002B2244D5|nr:MULTISPECIES: fluoride efflux transporter CrcB [unclassified Undibacterium]MEB0030567.1 fluoride efflux transporter CrcB [Undibacterium sp. RTI2.1]MEB0116932.1 fluoride efflux transporter CrcB [Undibacterium sp. RTI2.2]
MMNVLSFLAVGLGAALGAWLRWGLGIWLNATHPSFPIGTLLANLGGSYIIGLSVAFFSANPHLSPEWRLLVITGFLGGLTTFSTFSAESMALLQRGDYATALLHTSLHLFGSILLCFAGFASWRGLTHLS